MLLNHGKGMKLTAYEWEARAAAYEEAANHLETGQAWTEDRVELEQGNEVAKFLHKKAEECRLKCCTLRAFGKP